MTKRLRPVAAVVTGLLLGVSGCGGGGSSAGPAATGTPPAEGPRPKTPEPTPAPTTTAASGTPTGTPAAPPTTADAARGPVPANPAASGQPAAGRLAGQPFTPNAVEVEGNKLVFRQGKDVIPDLEVELIFDGDSLPDAGLKVVIRPGEPPVGGAVPLVHVGVRAGEGVPKITPYTDKYTLTLELGKKDRGKVPGKIDLTLPDPEKSHLAGTFEAAVVRGLNDPPGPGDVPYITGTVAHQGKPDQMLVVGYVGVTAAGQDVTDVVGANVKGAGAVRSVDQQPRVATLFPAKTPAAFDFVRLPPGRYLVAARLADGPSTWTWVEVKPGGTPSVALTLDPARIGTVEVKVPAGAKEQIQLLPADAGTEDKELKFLNGANFLLRYIAEPKDGTATVRNVAPGKYEVKGWFGGKPHTATVEVAAGKTAAVELKPAGK